MDTNSLIQSIETARFKVGRFGANYDMQDVDELLDRLAEALRADQPIEPLVLGARFRTVRSGYLPADVDKFLDGLRSAGNKAAAGSPDPELTEERAFTDQQPERRGLFARLFRNPPTT